MKKYKLSKTNIPEKYCTKIGEWFLLEDENGKVIQELAKPFYDILKGLMDYNSLLIAIKSQNKKRK